MTVVRLDESSVQAIFAAADQAGLLDRDIVTPDDFDWPTDTGSQTLTFVVDGRTLSHSVPTVSNEDIVDFGGNPAMVEVAEFIDVMIDDPEAIDGVTIEDDPRPYVPESWRVSSGYSYYADEARPWPLGEPPLLDTCMVMPTEAGDDTATGVYRYSDEIYDVEPVMPWEKCEPV